MIKILNRVQESFTLFGEKECLFNILIVNRNIFKDIRKTNNFE